MLSEDQCQIFNNLPIYTEDNLPYEVKSTLTYIAGYVTRKDEKNYSDTFSYFKTYGNFTSDLDRIRGGLCIYSKAFNL